jgi:hypothetical protein
VVVGLVVDVELLAVRTVVDTEEAAAVDLLHTSCRGGLNERWRRVLDDNLRNWKQAYDSLRQETCVGFLKTSGNSSRIDRGDVLRLLMNKYLPRFGVDRSTCLILPSVCLLLPIL